MLVITLRSAFYSQFVFHFEEIWARFSDSVGQERGPITKPGQSSIDRCSLLYLILVTVTISREY